MDEHIEAVVIHGDFFGIAIKLLEDKMLAASVFRYLKKMKPARQIECAMLMVDKGSGTYRAGAALVLRAIKRLHRRRI